MVFVSKTLRTGMAATLLLAGIAAGAQGDIGDIGASFGPPGSAPCKFAGRYSVPLAASRRSGGPSRMNLVCINCRIRQGQLGDAGQLGQRHRPLATGGVATADLGAR